jgi:hypothetical protein
MTPIARRSPHLRLLLRLVGGLWREDVPLLPLWEGTRLLGQEQTDAHLWTDGHQTVETQQSPRLSFKDGK